MPRRTQKKRAASVPLADPTPDSIDLATGLPKAYLAKACSQFEATEKSGDVVLPGPLAEAFADGRRQVGEFTLLPVTLGLLAILAQIKSPLLDVVRIMREELAAGTAVDESTTEGQAAAHALRMKRASGRMAKEIKSDEAASVETVFCFITPPPRLRALLATGRDRFRETAMTTLGDTIHPVVLAKLQAAVAGHYAASFATVIQHGDKPREGEVFTPPPPAPKTASAGGSAS